MPSKGKWWLLHHRHISSASAVGRFPSLSWPDSTTPCRPSKTSSQERSPTSVIDTGSASAATRQAAIPADHRPQPCRSLPHTVSWPKIPMRIDGARLDMEDSFPQIEGEGERRQTHHRAKEIVLKNATIASAKSKKSRPLIIHVRMGVLSVGWRLPFRLVHELTSRCSFARRPAARSLERLCGCCSGSGSARRAYRWMPRAERHPQPLHPPEKRSNGDAVAGMVSS